MQPLQLNPVQQIEEDFPHIACSSASGKCLCCFVHSVNLPVYKMATDRPFGGENRQAVVWARLCAHWTHYGMVSFLFSFISCLFCSESTFCTRVLNLKIHIKYTFGCLQMKGDTILPYLYSSPLIAFPFPYRSHLFFVPSLPPLMSLSPPFISRYHCASLLLFIIALMLSFFTSLSLRKQMCYLYDLFRCRDWDWESLLKAEGTLLEFKCLSILPTLITDANEFSSFIWITLFLLYLTEEIASLVSTWHNFPHLLA